VNSPKSNRVETREWLLNSAWPWVFIGAILAGATFALYWPSINFDFINYDDPDYVINNPMVQQGLNLHGVFWALRAVYSNNWHPITWMSHMLDVTAFGQLPRGPHAINILLHTLNTVLVFLWLSRLTGKRWRSAFVAALFAAHPLHVESVAWISERKDLLCAFFGLLALIAYGSYATGGAGRVKAYWAVLILFLLSLMSKAMLVTFPLILILLDYWPLKRFEGKTSPGTAVKQLLIEKIPFFFLSVGVGIITLVAQIGSGAAASVSALGPVPRIENALVSYVRYLSKSVWPESLAVFYPRVEFPIWEVVSATVFLAGLTVILVYARRTRPYLLVGWLWYVLMLIPVIGLIQVGKQSIADRYTYLPLLGIFIACTWGVAEIWERYRASRVPITALASVVIILCGIRTRTQLSYWRDSETLFRHALDVTKDNEVAYENLANYLADHNRDDEAIDYFRAALRIEPNNGSVHNDLGVSLLTKGNIGEATQEFHQALDFNPQSTNALLNLGVALDVQHEPRQAADYLNQAISLAPAYPEAHNDLGHVFVELGETNDAVKQFTEAIRLRPSYAQAHFNLGCVLEQLGQREGAIVQLTEALKLKPDYAAAKRQLDALTQSAP